MEQAKGESENLVLVISFPERAKILHCYLFKFLYQIPSILLFKSCKFHIQIKFLVFSNFKYLCYILFNLYALIVSILYFGIRVMFMQKIYQIFHNILLNLFKIPPDMAVPKPMWDDPESPQSATSPHMRKYAKYIFIPEFPNF